MPDYIFQPLLRQKRQTNKRSFRQSVPLTVHQSVIISVLPSYSDPSILCRYAGGRGFILPGAGRFSAHLESEDRSLLALNGKPDLPRNNSAPRSNPCPTSGGSFVDNMDQIAAIETAENGARALAIDDLTSSHATADPSAPDVQPASSPSAQSANPLNKPAVVQRLRIRDRAEWLRWRKGDVTASAVGALLDVHEYQTRYGLWMEKAGRLNDPVVETPAMRRGRLIEPVVVAMLREDHPSWTIRASKLYYRDPVIHLGATPDCRAKDPARPGWGNIQIKSVDAGAFKRKWHNANGDLEPPLWIVIQALVEAHLSNASWASVAVIVPAFAGFDLRLIEIPLHSELITAVRQRVQAFWQSIDAGIPPDPDFHRDADLFLKLQPEPDGSRIDLSDDADLPTLLAEDEALMADLRQKADRRKAIRAEVAGKLGTASYARFQGGFVTSRLTERAGYTVPASSYRDIRLTREV